VDYLIATLVTLANLVLLLLVFVHLPGTWFMLLLTLTVALVRSGMFSWWTLLAGLVLALLGELFEFLAGAAGTHFAGGSKLGAFGAIVGSVLGAVLGTVWIPIPVVGTILGTCIGAWLGAWGVELIKGRPMREALRSGTGGAAGTMGGLIAKGVLGAVIWILLAIAAFVP
jgi:hypothetical protein